MKFPSVLGKYGLQTRSVVSSSNDGRPNHGQTIHNACATVALLNIVMNVPEIELGETLSAFKAETQNLKPPYRGKRLGSNAFIRNIHNSFARYGLDIIPRVRESNNFYNRRMDILNADLSLYEDLKKWERSKNNKRRRTARKKKDDENEPGFHFIAYVPKDGIVWKLDGLRRQPEDLGIVLLDGIPNSSVLNKERFISAKKLAIYGYSEYH